MKIVLADDPQARVAAWNAGADWTGRYAEEILAHAGLPHQTLNPEDFREKLASSDVVLLPAALTLTDDAGHALADFVERGGTAIGIGGTAGLDALFGVETRNRLGEGYMEPVQPDHPILAEAQSSLHAFDFACLRPTTAQVLARTLAEDGTQTTFAAVAVRELGLGVAVSFAADLFGSIVRIQQGRPVRCDGPPAPDGTAAINDNILKTDDGIVLDWQRDRRPGDGVPYFAHPVADELRELLLKAVWWGVTRRGGAVPMLWYWPRHLDAVGHISHDTDQNLPDLGEALLDHMNARGVRSTWCVIYPGGYAPDFYRRIEACGSEVALHFDARTGGEHTRWDFSHLEIQHEWLKAMAPGARIVSNKNHYTRWEGYTEFFRWLERRGIQVDGTRGPSKRGNVGFLHGTCHPSFPMDDASGRNRLLDVLEVYLHTQDLALTCPYAVGPAIVDACVAHKGVAHFLFHPAHIKKPGVAEAITNIIDYGRGRGLEWWTSAEINDWERARRAVRIETVALGAANEHRGHGPGRACFDVVGDGPSLDVTLAFALGVSAAASVSIRAESAAAATPNEPVPLTVRTLRYAGQALFAVDLALSERVRLTLEW